MTHLIGRVGADRTLCGIKRNTPAAWPYMWVRWIHEVTYEVELCPDCADHWGVR